MELSLIRSLMDKPFYDDHKGARCPDRLFSKDVRKIKQAIDAAKNHMQQKVMVVDDVDRQVWELVSNVPHVSKPIAVAQFIINLILPGFGTCISACAA